MTYDEFEIKMNDAGFMRFIVDKHSDQYVGLDDDMPDDFDSWIENMELERAEKYLIEYEKSIVQSNKCILKCEPKQEYTHRDVIVATDQPDEVL